MAKNKSIKSLFDAYQKKSQKTSSCCSPMSKDLRIVFEECGEGSPPVPSPDTPPQDALLSEPKVVSLKATANAQDEVHDIDLLPHDPGQRKPISSYAHKDRDAVRRGYILKKPCQPKKYDFPKRKLRRFLVVWYDKYEWLEYSVEKDAAFCFPCYLFHDKVRAGRDSFVNGGFRGWNKTERFRKHVGGLHSAHNVALEKYELFSSQN